MYTGHVCFLDTLCKQELAPADGMWYPPTQAPWAENDPRLSFFCGTSWSQASQSCSQWCPDADDDNACPYGMYNACVLLLCSLFYSTLLHMHIERVHLFAFYNISYNIGRFVYTSTTHNPINLCREFMLMKDNRASVIHRVNILPSRHCHLQQDRQRKIQLRGTSFYLCIECYKSGRIVFGHLLYAHTLHLILQNNYLSI